jgi:hypothetical protein
MENGIYNKRLLIQCAVMMLTSTIVDEPPDSSRGRSVCSFSP